MQVGSGVVVAAAAGGKGATIVPRLGCSLSSGVETARDPPKATTARTLVAWQPEALRLPGDLRRWVKGE